MRLVLLASARPYLRTSQGSSLRTWYRPCTACTVMATHTTMSKPRTLSGMTHQNCNNVMECWHVLLTSAVAWLLMVPRFFRNILGRLECVHWVHMISHMQMRSIALLLCRFFNGRRLCTPWSWPSLAAGWRCLSLTGWCPPCTIAELCTWLH